MSAQIDLVWQGDTATAPPWPFGNVHSVQATPTELARVASALCRSEADALLFWDSKLGRPEMRAVQPLLRRPGDLWHAGLRLGLGGLPRLIDFVRPTWMFNRDPDADVEATSWRLSLRACLVRTEVLRQMGFINPAFESTEAAGLELGLRYLMSGVVPRHVPWLLTSDERAETATIKIEDEMRFVLQRFGARWMRWAAWRSLLTGRATPRAIRRACRQVAGERRVATPLYRSTFTRPRNGHPETVSVVIPTLDRYRYLYMLLEQLRGQTVRPLEILVVDQTPKPKRDERLEDRFVDLPLRVIRTDRAGQCSSRNAAIRAAVGELLLFIDDDDEVEPDLIAQHLARLNESGADVSAGVADEVGAGPLPEAFRHHRASDVFPTNNAMVRREVLARSGLFDLAYEHGQRADGDLGMRLYVKGALMLLNPGIKVLHHHAPRGGLRAHRARVVTYASSRGRLMHRHLPSVTEIYLARRYFRRSQVRESLILRVCGTFSARGSVLKKALKVIVSGICLPATLWQVYRRYRRASRMLVHYPRIPALNFAVLPVEPAYDLPLEKPSRVCGEL